jgi:hypothetical protein
LRFSELAIAHSLGSIIAVEHPLKPSHYARSWDPPDGALRFQLCGRDIEGILIRPPFNHGSPSCQQPQLLVNVSVVCHEGRIRVAERVPGPNSQSRSWLEPQGKWHLPLSSPAEVDPGRLGRLPKARQTSLRYVQLHIIAALKGVPTQPQHLSPLSHCGSRTNFVRLIKPGPTVFHNGSRLRVGSASAQIVRAKVLTSPYRSGPA